MSNRVPPGLRRAAQAFMVVSLLTPVTACESYAYETHSDGTINHVYCVDQETREIVDERFCDTTTATYYSYWVTEESHPVGYRVPIKHLKSLVPTTNPKARAKAGLPKAGKVGGTIVKGGGFGDGTTRGGGGTAKGTGGAKSGGG